ncbi:hypothetical protein FOL47_005636 [Perkinsus chesapeaki]|uniref:Uncharacterized protein n=1 Tax=Perkinsus chesapeaki TaxID=330153 RepID=A0A7J6MYK2_PERCH|nr:hypothetical protein FOL47_005636 [Perkinsus chesapeaki]
MTVFPYTSLLSLLLVAQAYRLSEQELLYSRVGNAEYVFIPNIPVPINRVNEAKRIGMSKIQKFRNEIKIEGKKEHNVDVSDFVIFHQDSDYIKNITHPKILRLEDGMTMEFNAKWHPISNCFEDVELVIPEDSSQTSERSEPVSLPFQEEMNEICKTGFSALKPSSGLLVSDGHYVGSRNDVTIDLKFMNNKVGSVGVAGDRSGVVYQPLCSGILAMAYAPLTRMILKKVKERGVLDRMLHARASDERFLCDARHIRRHIPWQQLTLWNHGLPDSFKVPTVSRLEHLE